MAKYRLHDIVTLKKGHPCGENKWMVMRTGVDIKLKCMGCQREIWLERIEFEKRLRKIQMEDGKFVAVVNVERE